MPLCVFLLCLSLSVCIFPPSPYVTYISLIRLSLCLCLSQGRVVKGAYRFQAVITTFEMILGGCPELNAIEWRCVIIDEAHRLKNKNCKLLEGFKLMRLVQQQKHRHGFDI